MPSIESSKPVATPGLLSGILFFIVVLAGAGYIVISKLNGLPAVFVTLVPVFIMLTYAVLLGFARLFRLRDDQSGDNLYYMGFLFTLTSLAVSLYQFRADEASADLIVQNFGIAIASTIAGIALRILFNQMRRDPIEVEHTARLELADAARKVKRELESTILEFSYFRRATQQSLAEAVEEINSQLKDAKGSIVKQLHEFATTSSKPLEEASKKSGDTLDAAVKHIADDVGQLSQSTEQLVKSLTKLGAKLDSLQTPDHIIEIKMNPMIQGISRAVNNFGKHAEIQAKAVERNLKQTQEMTTSLAALLALLRASLTQTAADPGGVTSDSAPTGMADHEIRAPNA